MDVCSATYEASDSVSGFSELSKEPPDCGFSNPDSALYKSSENVNGFSELSNETPDCVFSNPEELCVHDLGCQFTEFLNIQHGEYTTEKNNSDTLKEDGSKDIHQDDTGNAASEKCLIKCATFPCSHTSTPPAELVYGEEPEDGTTAEVMAHKADATSADLPFRSTSLPTPLKLVSAIKGSREKVGRPSRNLTVTWAPDVYDPVPTVESHVPNKGQRHRSDNKKYAKSKQKSSSKSSRGSKGKDKKQPRRHGGSSKRSSHFLDDNNITCSSELQASILDFDISSSPDPFCGSSFLRKSVTKLHYPVAEAT